jgi:DNA-binding NarL/FixJ family response regulator
VSRGRRPCPAAYTVPITAPLDEIRAMAEAELACLTAAEVEVLVRIAKGYSTKEIAFQLHRSPKTIEQQRYTLTTRLGMTFVEAAVLAGKAGWA